MSTAAHNYKQGYSTSTTASHASRTVHTDAAFLLPYIKSTDKILDVGCGPGTITVGFCRYVPEGSVVGIDLSEDVISRARTLAAKQKEFGGGAAPLGTVEFQTADLFAGLPWPNDWFDVVFASQLFPHLPPTELPVRALGEMRRVLKPGGILATRDAAAQHFFPSSLRLDGFWVVRHLRSLGREEWPGSSMPSYFRSAGFCAPSPDSGPQPGQAGTVLVGTGTTSYAGKAQVSWWGENMAGRLREGDAFRESWKAVGYSEEEIEDSKRRMQMWAKTEDAWYACLQCEILAWK